VTNEQAVIHYSIGTV